MNQELTLGDILKEHVSYQFPPTILDDVLSFLILNVLKNNGSICLKKLIDEILDELFEFMGISSDKRVSYVDEIREKWLQTDVDIYKILSIGEIILFWLYCYSQPGAFPIVLAKGEPIHTVMYRLRVEKLLDFDDPLTLRTIISIR